MEDSCLCWIIWCICHCVKNFSGVIGVIFESRLIPARVNAVLNALIRQRCTNFFASSWVRRPYCRCPVYTRPVIPGLTDRPAKIYQKEGPGFYLENLLWHLADTFSKFYGVKIPEFGLFIYSFIRLLNQSTRNHNIFSTPVIFCVALIPIFRTVWSLN